MPGAAQRVKRKRGKGYSRETKGLGPPAISVREPAVERHKIDQLPRRVSRRMAELGATHADVAKALGVSGAALSIYTHRRTMSLALFRRLCAALQVTEDHKCWHEPLPVALSAADGVQAVIARAQQRLKTWL